MSDEHLRKDCQESITCAICFQSGHPSVLHFINREGGEGSYRSEPRPRFRSGEQKDPSAHLTGANSHDWRTAQQATQPHRQIKPKYIHHKSPYRRENAAPDPHRLKSERNRDSESAKHPACSGVRPTARNTSIPRLLQITVEPPTANSPTPGYHSTERGQPNNRQGTRFEVGRGCGRAFENGLHTRIYHKTSESINNVNL